jgi:hypothetical protein
VERLTLNAGGRLDSLDHDCNQVTTRLQPRKFIGGWRFQDDASRRTLQLQRSLYGVVAADSKERYGVCHPEQSTAERPGRMGIVTTGNSAY